MFNEVLDRFVEHSAVSVMFRGTLENAVTPKLLDDVFAEHAQRQEPGKLLFSATVELLGLVATRVRDSVNDAYLARREAFPVTVQEVYRKMRGVETQVSRQLVRQTAARMAAIVDALKVQRKPLVPGYRTKIIDGNHLAGTEHRLKELRTLRSAPLPGLALVVLEPDRMLLTDAFPCKDAYAQERRLLVQVLASVTAKDLWIADRNFCTTEFLFGIASRGGAFLIRQHASTLTYELLGKRRRIGRCPTGTIYEQAMRLFHADGQTLDVRRITIELDKPTRDGETEIHLVTNLAADVVDARRAADLYLLRWTVENAFQELDQALASEIKTLAYPSAALLSFCVALLTYNLVSVVKSALAVEHKGEVERSTLSGYYLAGEIAAAYHGLSIAVSPRQWQRYFAALSPAKMAETLKTLASHVQPDRFRKNVRGPKKPRPKRLTGKRYHHVSTQRILTARRQKTLSLKALKG